MLHPTTTHYLESTQGGTLYVEIYGETDKPRHTVVFVNGLGGTIARWIPLLRKLLELKPDTQCITYEHRGHTESTHLFPQKPNFCAVLTTDLADVIEQTAKHPPLLVGHSMGALLTEMYLKKAAEPPAGCVHISPPLQLPILPTSWHERLYTRLARWSSSHSVSTSKDSAQKKAAQLSEAQFDLSFERVLFEIHTLGLLPFFLSWGCLLTTRHTSEPKLYANTAQPLFVFGTADMLVPHSVCEQMQQQYGKEAVQELLANHNMLRTRAEVLAEIIASRI